MQRHNIFSMIATALVLLSVHVAHAGTPMMDRVAVEAKDAARIVNQDILASNGRIMSTPTYILAGIHFPSCDFTAGQLREALVLAKKARANDPDATTQLVNIIVNGLMNEPTL